MNEALQVYQTYTTIEFFKDETFVDSVKHPTPEKEQFWQELLLTYPDRRPFIEEARQWIEWLQNQPLYIPQQSETEAWGQLWEKIEEKERYQRTYIRPIRRATQWASAAAAVVLVFFAGRELIQLGDQQVETPFGQLSTITLPDETEVVLNGNSKIHYSRNWKSSKPREIWAEGEVSFHVKHVAIQNRVQESDSFRVHVNGLNLTVLGTRFNVKSRRQKTEISLLEGRIKVEKPGVFVRYLKPGESLGYDARTSQLQALDRSPQANAAWVNKELELTGYTMADVVGILEDTYGYTVTVDKPESLSKRLNGTVPAANPDDILFVIEKVFDVKIERQHQHLIIHTP
ncbi:hypothetical protein BWI96_07800 [Siphonobacter sp. SORGH_AS_0500]|uniref:FecR family protein n=1 Tax=Siphonobacter sp. SORGH_AS_0500 TaxID=1864824 RepID=UPI000CB521A4|nr:FecR domain-containing protein [Siphonobacter sp. SORGH_AS_0500]PKK37241.1 hypothetical protein BWI96_07800 [Siphonobacter sp. SORGH_AS_0500]